MRHTAQVAAVMDRLKLELDGWRVPPSARTVTFTPPSLLSEETYAGVPLRTLMLPKAPKNLGPVLTAFEQILAGGDPDFPPGVAGFINRNPARLLLWASTRRDADLYLSVEENRLMVIGEETFGFADGLAYTSKEATPYEVRLADLFVPKPYMTREAGFIALWKRAKRLRRPDAQHALEALRAYRTASWRSLARWTWTVKSQVNLSELGEMIYTSHDPVGDLYTHLVPKVVTHAAFDKAIFPVKGRPLDPGKDFRTTLWRKVSSLLE